MNKRIREYIRNMVTNYDHDQDAHRYRTSCRVCEAEALWDDLQKIDAIEFSEGEIDRVEEALYHDIGDADEAGAFVARVVEALKYFQKVNP